jgi:pyruvate formate lyase activating enzyme
MVIWGGGRPYFDFLLAKDDESMKEAMFWEPEDKQRVQCNLCNHRCVIKPDKRGICGVRENRNGILYSLVYGRAGAQAVDPIEKKPLYHFLPGTDTFSIATRGCNFKCLHCQNCDLSQVAADESFSAEAVVSPERAVKSAEEYRCESISYTYSEPTIFFEYAYDMARLAARRGLKNILVTNGYITPEALREFAPYIDAANIDLKFFRGDLYRKICGARLQPVLDTIGMYRELGIWIEITTLIIPTYNDSEDQLLGIAGFIAGLGTQIPWHISAFYPTYKLTDIPPTQPAALRKAKEIGSAQGLKHIYTGNINERPDTLCPKCRAVLIERSRFSSRAIRMEGGKCPDCGADIAGVWA